MEFIKLTSDYFVLIFFISFPTLEQAGEHLRPVTGGKALEAGNNGDWISPYAKAV